MVSTLNPTLWSGERLRSNLAAGGVVSTTPSLPPFLCLRDGRAEAKAHSPLDGGSARSAVRCHRRIDASLSARGSDVSRSAFTTRTSKMFLPLLPALAGAGRVSEGLEGVCPWRILFAYGRASPGVYMERVSLGELRLSSPLVVNAALARHSQSPANGRFDEYSGSSPLGALGGGRDSRCLARTSEACLLYTSDAADEL